MNLIEAFVLDVSKGICLVPSSRKDVKRYLTTDRERKIVIREFLSQYFDKGIPQAMFLCEDVGGTATKIWKQLPCRTIRTRCVLQCYICGSGAFVRREFEQICSRSVATNGTDIDHAVSEFYECTSRQQHWSRYRIPHSNHSPFDRNIHVGEVM